MPSIFLPKPIAALSDYINNSNLSDSISTKLINNFEEYFSICETLENNAKKIKVTSALQKEEIDKAAKEKKKVSNIRIEVEKRRKILKENSLREGKAIDGIANVLKALLIPIENYLDDQANFLNILAKKRVEEETQKILFEEKRKEQERELKMLAEEAEKIKQSENIAKSTAETISRLIHENAELMDKLDDTLDKEYLKIDKDANGKIKYIKTINGHNIKINPCRTTLYIENNTLYLKANITKKVYKILAVQVEEIE